MQWTERSPWVLKNKIGTWPQTAPMRMFQECAIYPFLFSSFPPVHRDSSLESHPTISERLLSEGRASQSSRSVPFSFPQCPPVLFPLICSLCFCHLFTLSLAFAFFLFTAPTNHNPQQLTPLQSNPAPFGWPPAV